MPACCAAAIASKVDVSSSAGMWNCFSSCSDSRSERKDTCDDVESRRRELVFPGAVEFWKEKSSVSRKSSSSQHSISSSTGFRGFNRIGSMVANGVVQNDLALASRDAARAINQFDVHKDVRTVA